MEDLFISTDTASKFLPQYVGKNLNQVQNAQKIMREKQFQQLKKISNCIPSDLNSEITTPLQTALERQTCALDVLEKVCGMERHFQEYSSHLDRETTNLLSNMRYHQFVHQVDFRQIQPFLMERMIEKESINDSWCWLKILNTCMAVHLHNSAEYHKFFEDAEFCVTVQQALNQLVHKCHSKTPFIVSVLVKHLKNVRNVLLTLQDISERLLIGSRTIRDIKLRVNGGAGYFAVSLVTYHTPEFQLRKGQYVKLLDISKDLWQIELLTSDDITGVSNHVECNKYFVPSVLLDIDKPFGAAIDLANKIRQQMAACWKDTRTFMRVELINSVLALLKKQNTEMGVLKQEDVNLLKDTLHGEDFSFRELLTCLDAVQKYRKDDETNKQWYTSLDSTNMKQAVLLFMDIDCYWHYYSDAMNVNCTKMQYHFTSETVTYVSAAYLNNYNEFQMCDEKSIEKEEKNSIMSLAEKAPDSRSTFFVPYSNGYASDAEVVKENVTVAIMKTNVEAFLQDTVNVNKRWIIVGVYDHCQDQMISVYKAVDCGILNLSSGTYCNNATDEIVPISVAMSEHLINGEIIDSNITEDFVESYILSKTDECVDFNEVKLLGAIDTISNKLLSIDEAVSCKVLNDSLEVFTDTALEKTCSLKRAIDAGLVLVKSISQSDLAVSRLLVISVLDLQSGVILNLANAMTRGIIQNQIYACRGSDLVQKLDDTSDGVVRIPLYQAVLLGLLNVAEPSPLIQRNCTLIVQHPSRINSEELLFKGRRVGLPPNRHLLTALFFCNMLNEFMCWPTSASTNDVISIDEAARHELLQLDPFGLRTKRSIKDSSHRDVISSEEALNFRVWEILRSLAHPESFLKVLQILPTSDKLPQIISHEDVMKMKDVTMDDASAIFLLGCDNLSLCTVSTVTPASVDHRFHTRINMAWLRKKLQMLNTLESVGCNTNMKGIQCDDEKNRSCTIAEAILSDLLNLSNLSFGPQQLLLSHAYRRKYLDQPSTLEVARSIHRLSLGFQVDKLASGELSLSTLATRDPLQPPHLEAMYVIYVPTEEILSVGALRDRGLLDCDSGEVINGSGQRVAFKEAIATRVIDLWVYPSQIYLGKSIGAVFDTKDKRILSVPEARAIGVINKDYCKIIDTRLEFSYGLEGAWSKRLVLLLPVGQAGDKNCVFSVDYVKDSTSGLTSTLKEALLNGLIDEYAEFYIDPLTKQQITLCEAYAKGLIGLSYPDALTGAINPRHLIIIPPEECQRLLALQKLSSEKKYSPDVVLLISSNEAVGGQLLISNDELMYKTKSVRQKPLLEALFNNEIVGSDIEEIIAFTKKKALKHLFPVELQSSATALSVDQIAHLFEKEKNEEDESKRCNHFCLNPETNQIVTLRKIMNNEYEPHVSILPDIDFKLLVQLVMLKENGVDIDDDTILKPESAEYISLNEAVLLSHFNLDNMCYVCANKANNVPLSRSAAAQDGVDCLPLVKETVSRQLANFVKKNCLDRRTLSQCDLLSDTDMTYVGLMEGTEVATLGHLIKQDCLNPTNTAAGYKMESSEDMQLKVQDALARNLILESVSKWSLLAGKHIVAVLDTKEAKLVTQNDAIKNNTLDMWNETVRDTSADTLMDFDSAEEKNILITKFPQENVHFSLFPVKHVVDPTTGKQVSLKKAKQKGLVGTKDYVLCDTYTIPFDEAKYLGVLGEGGTAAAAAGDHLIIKEQFENLNRTIRKENIPVLSHFQSGLDRFAPKSIVDMLFENNIETDPIRARDTSGTGVMIPIIEALVKEMFSVDDVMKLLTFCETNDLCHSFTFVSKTEAFTPKALSIFVNEKTTKKSRSSIFLMNTNTFDILSLDAVLSSPGLAEQEQASFVGAIDTLEIAKLLYQLLTLKSNGVDIETPCVYDGNMDAYISLWKAAFQHLFDMDTLSYVEQGCGENAAHAISLFEAVSQSKVRFEAAQSLCVAACRLSLKEFLTEQGATLTLNDINAIVTENKPSRWHSVYVGTHCGTGATTVAKRFDMCEDGSTLQLLDALDKAEIEAELCTFQLLHGKVVSGIIDTKQCEVMTWKAASLAGIVDHDLTQVLDTHANLWISAPQALERSILLAQNLHEELIKCEYLPVKFVVNPKSGEKISVLEAQSHGLLRNNQYQLCANYEMPLYEAVDLGCIVMAGKAMKNEPSNYILLARPRSALDIPLRKSNVFMLALLQECFPAPIAIFDECKSIVELAHCGYLNTHNATLTKNDSASSLLGLAVNGIVSKADLHHFLQSIALWEAAAVAPPLFYNVQAIGVDELRARCLQCQTKSDMSNKWVLEECGKAFFSLRSLGNEANQVEANVFTKIPIDDLLLKIKQLNHARIQGCLIDSAAIKCRENILLSLSEACFSNRFSLDDFSLRSNAYEKMALHDAVEVGLVSNQLAKQLACMASENCLQNLLAKQTVDLSSGTVLSKDGSFLYKPDSDAADLLFDPDLIYVLEGKQHKSLTSLGKLLREDKLNFATLTYKNNDNESMSFTSALANESIIASVNVWDVLFNQEIVGIVDCTSQAVLSRASARTCKLIDEYENVYLHPTLGAIHFHEAIEKHLVLSKPFGASYDMIRAAVVHVVNPVSGAFMSLEQAEKCDIINQHSNTMKISLNETTAYVTLFQILQCGLLKLSLVNKQPADWIVIHVPKNLNLSSEKLLELCPENALNVNLLNKLLRANCFEHFVNSMDCSLCVPQLISSGQLNPKTLVLNLKNSNNPNDGWGVFHPNLDELVVQKENLCTLRRLIADDMLGIVNEGIPTVLFGAEVPVDLEGFLMQVDNGALHSASWVTEPNSKCATLCFLSRLVTDHPSTLASHRRVLELWQDAGCDVKHAGITHPRTGITVSLEVGVLSGLVDPDNIRFEDVPLALAVTEKQGPLCSSYLLQSLGAALAKLSAASALPVWLESCQDLRWTYLWSSQLSPPRLTSLRELECAGLLQRLANNQVHFIVNDSTHLDFDAAVSTSLVKCNLTDECVPQPSITLDELKSVKSAVSALLPQHQDLKEDLNAWERVLKLPVHFPQPEPEVVRLLQLADAKDCQIFTLQESLDKELLIMKSIVKVDRNGGNLHYDGNPEIIRLLQSMHAIFQWICTVESQLTNERSFEELDKDIIYQRIEQQKHSNSRIFVEKEPIAALLQRAHVFLRDHEHEISFDATFEHHYKHLKTRTANLEERFNQIYDQFKDRLIALHGISYTLDDFLENVENYREFNRKTSSELSELQVSASSMKREDEKKALSLNVKNIEERVNSHWANVTLVARIGLKLNKSVSEYENRLNNYRIQFGMPAVKPMIEQCVQNCKTAVHDVETRHERLKHQLNRIEMSVESHDTSLALKQEVEERFANLQTAVHKIQMEASEVSKLSELYEHRDRLAQILNDATILQNELNQHLVRENHISFEWLNDCLSKTTNLRHQADALLLEETRFCENIEQLNGRVHVIRDEVERISKTLKEEQDKQISSSEILNIEACDQRLTDLSANLQSLSSACQFVCPDILKECKDEVKLLHDVLHTCQLQVQSGTPSAKEFQKEMHSFQEKCALLKQWLTDMFPKIKMASATPNKLIAFDLLTQEVDCYRREVEVLYEKSQLLLSNDHMKDVDSVRSQTNHLQESLQVLSKALSTETIKEIRLKLKEAEKDLSSTELDLANMPSLRSDRLAEQKSQIDTLDQSIKKTDAASTQLELMLNKSVLDHPEEVDNVGEQIGAVKVRCRAVSNRLAQLTENMEALEPLLKNLESKEEDLLKFCAKMETELLSLSEPHETVEELKKQMQDVADLNEMFEEKGASMSDVNETIAALQKMMSGEEMEELTNDSALLQTRFSAQEEQLAQLSATLSAAMKSTCTNVVDSLHQHLELLAALRGQLNDLEPLNSTPEEISAKMTATQNMLKALHELEAEIATLKEEAQLFMAEDEDLNGLDEFEVKDIEDGFKEFADEYDDLFKLLHLRNDTLTDLLRFSTDFWSEIRSVECALEEQQNSLISFSPLMIDVTIEQQKMDILFNLRQAFNTAKNKFDSTCVTLGDTLLAKCSPSASFELQVKLDELKDKLEDLNEDLLDKIQHFEDNLKQVKRYCDRLKKLEAWFPVIEEQLENISSNTATSVSTLLQNIKELNSLKGTYDVNRHVKGPIPHVFKAQVLSHYVDVEGLAVDARELLDRDDRCENKLDVRSTVDKMYARWKGLVHQISVEERKQQENLVNLGEVEQLAEHLQHIVDSRTEDLKTYGDVIGDAKVIATCLSAVNHIEKEVHQVGVALKKLNSKIENKNVLSHLNSTFAQLQLALVDRRGQLKAALRKVELYMQEMQDSGVKLDAFKLAVRHVKRPGVLPLTAQRELDRYKALFAQLKEKESHVMRLLLQGREYVTRATPSRSFCVQEELTKLDKKWHTCLKVGDKKMHFLEKHLARVVQFDKELSAAHNWMLTAEIVLKRFQQPSKITLTCANQLQEHKTHTDQLNQWKPLIDKLITVGTRLKYTGSMEESLTMGNCLAELQLRFKRAVRRSFERGRILEQALREDKRFSFSYEDLMLWLAQKIALLKRFDENSDKDMIDMVLKIFQEQHLRHPQLYSTQRLGKNLQERCTKLDPEREQLSSLKLALKQRWQELIFVGHEKRRLLDNILLRAGRMNDAKDAVMQWLNKLAEAVSADESVMGDLNAVELLFEQQCAVENDLSAREEMVRCLLLEPNVRELQTLWTLVQQLVATRRGRLETARTTAEHFQQLYNEIIQLLPHIEEELRFKPLPDNETELVAALEQHEKLTAEIELTGLKQERLVTCCQVIIDQCPPVTRRQLRKTLSELEGRWHQVQIRKNARLTKLQQALKIFKGSGAHLEELLQWLLKSQSSLIASEQTALPDSLKEVQQLSDQHQAFHQQLAEVKRQVDCLVTAANAQRKRSNVKNVDKSLYHCHQNTTIAKNNNAIADTNGGNVTTSTSSVFKKRCLQLENRYRSVFRLSVTRRERLQLAIDKLQEAAGFQGFTFDEWRIRYLTWIRSNHLRLTDVFRRGDRDGSGTLTRDEFISIIMKSKFSCNRLELNAVFNIFDKSGDEEIDYEEFLHALEPSRRRGGKATDKKKTEGQVIHEEIEKQLAKCKCSKQFQAEKVAEGKYRFGEQGKLYMLRIMNTNIMVRVGGGWVTLQEFLETHDPCRPGCINKVQQLQQRRRGMSISSTDNALIQRNVRMLASPRDLSNSSSTETDKTSSNSPKITKRNITTSIAAKAGTTMTTTTGAGRLLNTTTTSRSAAGSTSGASRSGVNKK